MVFLKITLHVNDLRDFYPISQVEGDSKPCIYFKLPADETFVGT